MYILKKENDTYLMTVEKIKTGDHNEYWLELTNKNTLMTQTLISHNKKSIMFENYSLDYISKKLNHWGIEHQLVYS